MESNNYYIKNKKELIGMFRDSEKYQNEVLCRYFEIKKVEHWINEAYL